MSNRWFLLAAAAIGFMARDVHAQATSVTLQLFPLTGEVRFLNESSNPFSFTFYSLNSPSGALNGADGVWTSISDVYDVSGNGFIDPVNNWVELDSTSTKLSEAGFSLAGGTLPAYRAISLGKIWNPNAVPVHDISAQVVLSSGGNATVLVRQSLDGDYLRDGVVNSVDYDIWKAVYGGSLSTGYFADGNIDGILDAADYTVWRDNFGASLPGIGTIEAGSGSLSISAVPEPSSVLLGIAAGTAWLLTNRRRRERRSGIH